MPRWNHTPKSKKAEENGKPEPIARVIEPRCKVCQHPHRNAIDKLLAMKTPAIQIEAHFSTDEEKLDRRSIASHDKKHLNYEDVAIQRLVEAEAQQAQETLEQGVKGALSRRLLLDIANHKALEALLHDEMEIELKDAIKVVELREKMDNESQGVAFEEMDRQFRAFKQAIQEQVPRAMWQGLVERTKEILGSPLEDGTVPPAIEPPKDD